MTDSSRFCAQTKLTGIAVNPPHQWSFFRHCPQCGRRFHIKLVSKTLAHMDREPIRRTNVSPTVGGRGLAQAASMPYFVVREGPPIIIDIEEFQYAYKCNHCGHEWSEKHIEEHKEG